MEQFVDIPVPVQQEDVVQIPVELPQKRVIQQSVEQLVEAAGETEFHPLVHLFSYQLGVIYRAVKWW